MNQNCIILFLFFNALLLFIHTMWCIGISLTQFLTKSSKTASIGYAFHLVWVIYLYGCTAQQENLKYGRRSHHPLCSLKWMPLTILSGKHLRWKQRLKVVWNFLLCVAARMMVVCIKGMENKQERKFSDIHNICARALIVILFPFVPGSWDTRSIHTHIHKSTTVFCTLRPAASPCAFSQDFCRRRNIIIVEEFIGAKFTNNFFLQLYSTALHQTTTKLVLLLTRIGNSQKAEEPAKKWPSSLAAKKVYIM